MRFKKIWNQDFEEKVKINEIDCTLSLICQTSSPSEFTVLGLAPRPCIKIAASQVFFVGYDLFTAQRISDLLRCFTWKIYIVAPQI